MGADLHDDERPTLGEVFRLVRALSQQVSRLEDRMVADWLTKEVYDVRHNELANRVVLIEERNRRADYRKYTVWAGLATLAGSNVVALILALSTHAAGH